MSLVAPTLEVAKPPQASPETRAIADGYRALVRRRRTYSVLSATILLVALFFSLRFANETNAAGFFERLPHLFDFVSWLVPDQWSRVWRALLDLPTPYDNGTQATDFEAGRHYLTETLYIPEYVWKMLETINIAILSTLVGGALGFVLSFFAASNLMGAASVRWVTRRFLEVLRAFPEIVIAGFFAAVLSLGPIPAIFAVAIHTVGALGKLFYEVAENIDMKADEGLRATGASWVQRMRYGVVPHVLPNFLSYALLRLEINVRASTIIGAVGGGGIGEVLRLSISRGWGAQTLAIIALLFLTIVAVDQISAHFRRKLVGAHSFTLGGG